MATGETHTVKEFVERAFACVGIAIGWRGAGTEEVGFDQSQEDRVLVRVDPAYFRPTEVELLIGDPTKAHKQLGWVSRTSFADLVREMVEADVKMLNHANE